MTQTPSPVIEDCQRSLFHIKRLCWKLSILLLNINWMIQYYEMGFSQASLSVRRGVFSSYLSKAIAWWIWIFLYKPLWNPILSIHFLSTYKRNISNESFLCSLSSFRTCLFSANIQCRIRCIMEFIQRYISKTVCINARRNWPVRIKNCCFFLYS